MAAQDAGNTFLNGFTVKSGSKNYVFTKQSIAEGDSSKFYSVTLTSDASISSYNAQNQGTFYTIDGSAVTQNDLNLQGDGVDQYLIGSSTKANTLWGGAGNDTLHGGSAGNIFRYTNGKDIVENYDIAKDNVSVGSGVKFTEGKFASDKLTFKVDGNNQLTFANATEASKISLNGGGYLTKDGQASGESATRTFKLFSGTKGKVDFTGDAYSETFASIDASAVKNQAVTLVGKSLASGTTNYILYDGNKKHDVIEYGGGQISVSNFEGGYDKLNMDAFGVSGFSVDDSDNVVISLGSDSNNVVSLAGAKDKEVLLHDETNKGNSYSKMFFHANGVLYDKAKATSATLWSGASDYTAEDSVKKVTVKDSSVSGVSITANAKYNTNIDASAAGGSVSLYSGAKNDKFTGSAANADTFIYSAGKDVINGFVTTSDAADQISLGSNELTAAKISAGKKSLKFTFDSKNVLTVKGESMNSATVTVDGAAYSFGKNAIISGTNVSLTSQFGGTYNVKKSGGKYIDGELVSKNLTFKGTSSAESLIGGAKKTTFKGGGGADSLVGGEGKDTFFYAKGDKDTVTIAKFDFSKDKLKIAGGTIAKNGITSLESGGVQFAMKKDKGTDAAAVGWFDVKSFTKDNVAVTDASKVAIKANNTYYWFAEGGEILASDETSTVAAGALITSISKVSNSQISDYEVIELNYATNLVKSNVAVQVTTGPKSK